MNTDFSLLCPPAAFLVILAASGLMSVVFSGLALRSKNKAPGKTKAYACGEDVANHHAQPEYSQFFPFAFFFTIMHVVALIVATVPVANGSVVLLAGLYLLAAVTGLFILYRN
jgi:NADH:ubiquinone oxidoreductase subunit 3 (subunit A)